MEKAKRKKLGRRILGIVLTVALMGLLQAIPGTVRTAYAAQAGAFTVDGGEAGTDYAYADGVLTIKTATAMTIKNSNPEDPTTDTIVVTKGVSANITLAGVTIDVSATENACAFKIENDSTGSVIITLADGSTNILKSGGNCAGLQKNGTEGTLIIRGGTYGTGSLEATGGGGGAGIGSGYNNPSKNITIEGGKVTAAGGDALAGGAGIGGGGNGAGTDIIIEGGTVTATGGGINNFGGAGIGGGGYKAGTGIIIKGGDVTATGGNYGAGIGGGYKGAGSDITIEGGKVTATGGGTSDISYGGAGIGGGCEGAGTGIIIKDGDVTATGGNRGAGIGGGNREAGTDIKISGGTVTATGGQYAAGIGGGEQGTGSDIRITGGTVTARGGSNGAGIGGGLNGAGNGIKITGGAVTTEGGNWGAGIGGGRSGTGSDIIISGGSVKATSINANKFGGGSNKAPVTPTLEDGTTAVYLLEIKNEDSVDIVIDAKEYPAGHGEEKKIYAYLPAKTEADPNEVTVGVIYTGYYYDTTNSQWKQTTTHTHSDEDGNGICDDAGCSYVYNHADKDGNGICNKCMVYIAPEYANGCYRIANEGNLYWFAEYVNAGNKSVNAELTADIDFNGWDFSLRPWTPICQTQSFHASATTDNGYSGTFDGKGYTISNLIVTGKSGDIYSYGLFGTVSGTVKNLGMIGYKYTLGNVEDARAGSVVGQVLADGTIENCYSVGHTVDTNNSKIAGGIAGCNYGGTIRNCYAYDGTVNGHQTRWGGVVGDCQKDSSAPDLAQSYGTVLNCYTDVTRVVSTQSEKATIAKCELKGSTAFASGEVAYLLNGTVTDGVWSAGATDGTQSWYQTLTGNSVDVCPVLDSEHGTVYQVNKYDCPDDTEAEILYCNTNEEIRGTEHVDANEDGHCDICNSERIPAVDSNDDGVYEIGNDYQLYWFAEFVNSGNKAANAELTADIDFSEWNFSAKPWTPICQTISYHVSETPNDAGYSGTFDGNGYTILNLTVKGISGGTYSYGLFGTVSGTVKNLGMVNYKFTVGSASDARAGSVAGQVLTDGTITNCYSVGHNVDTNDSKIAGGIAGCNYGGTISNCYALNGTVTGYEDRWGGVVGDSKKDSTAPDLAQTYGIVSNCYTDDTRVVSSQNDSGSITNCAVKDDDAFASGEVAYLLNDSSGEDVTWYQTLEEDAYPVLDNTRGKVYMGYDQCKAVYANEKSNAEQGNHTWVSGECSHCGLVCSHEWVNDTCSICGYVCEKEITIVCTEGTFSEGEYTFDIATKVHTINTNKAVTISGTTTTETVVIAKDVSANITLNNVSINVSATAYACAFKIEDNSTGNVTITLADGSTNILKSGDNCAGLQKNGTEGTLIIRGGTYGTGSLEATGGGGGAGIGSGYNNPSKNITIEGGKVTATGGDAYGGGAGIGGGRYGAGSDITISGGSVKAVAGWEACAIGGYGSFFEGYPVIPVTPTLQNKTTPVYLLEVDNAESANIVINGVDYPDAHGTEAKIYAYLPAKSGEEPNVISVGEDVTRYYYDKNIGSWIKTCGSGNHVDANGDCICDNNNCDIRFAAAVTTADGSSKTSYISLEEAISVAKEHEGSTVTLGGNLAMETCVTVDSGTFTIDLDGYCWESSTWALCVEGTAKVTITGGSFAGENEDIYWKGGTIVLSDHSSPDDIKVRRDGAATTTIADIVLPEGYVLIDGNGAVADDFSGAADDDSTVYTVKKDNRKTVTFDPNGGTCSMPSVVTTLEGKLTSLPMATHDGLYFKGWYDAREGGNEITLNYVFTVDTTIYAQYRDECPHDASDIENGKCVCGKGYIYVELADSYGDGWNGSAIDLWKNGELIETMTVEQEATATYLLEYDSLSYYSFWWIKGAYPEECSFTIYAAGDMKLEATEDDCENYIGDQTILVLGFGIAEQPTTYNMTVTTNDENATYQWYEVEGPALDTQTDTLLTEETAATLAAPEIGKSYACLVTFSNGVAKASNVVYCVPVITEQPTVMNPTVGTNDTEATYQWYEASDIVEVTMENIYEDGDDWEAVNETGWFTCKYSGGYESYYFALELKAGDVVTVSTKESISNYYRDLFITNFDSGEWYYFESVNGSEYEFSIEVPEDGIWYIGTVEYVCIKATIGRHTADMTKPVEGEDEATLQNPVRGKSYACVVTFRDDTTETSKVISYEEATILGTNVTLTDIIEMNFYVKVPEDMAPENVKVKFTVNGVEKAPVALTGTADDGVYRGTCKVAAKEMTDEITAELMVDGTVVDSYTTSVRQYGETVLNGYFGRTTKELVKAMLNYGAYAQTYFDYNTTNLANAGHEDNTLTVNVNALKAYVPEVTGNNDALEYAGSALILESDTKVRHYFKLTEETAQGNLNGLKRCEAPEGEDPNGIYYCYEKSFIVTALGDMTSYTVEGITFKYSPLSYVTTVLMNTNTALTTGEDAIKLQNLMKALYCYYWKAANHGLDNQ